MHRARFDIKREKIHLLLFHLPKKVPGKTVFSPLYQVRPYIKEKASKWFVVGAFNIHQSRLLMVESNSACRK